METTQFFSDESMTDAATFQDQSFDFNLQNQDAPTPDDDEDENDDEDDDKGSNESGNDDPPLDQDVVHSPVIPQDGGKPKR